METVTLKIKLDKLSQYDYPYATPDLYAPDIV